MSLSFVKVVYVLTLSFVKVVYIVSLSFVKVVYIVSLSFVAPVADVSLLQFRFFQLLLKCFCALLSPLPLLLHIPDLSVQPALLIVQYAHSEANTQRGHR